MFSEATVIVLFLRTDSSDYDLELFFSSYSSKTWNSCSNLSNSYFFFSSTTLGYSLFLDSLSLVETYPKLVCKLAAFVVYFLSSCSIYLFSLLSLFAYFYWDYLISFFKLFILFCWLSLSYSLNSFISSFCFSDSAKAAAAIAVASNFLRSSSFLCLSASSSYIYFSSNISCSFYYYNYFSSLSCSY